MKNENENEKKVINKKINIMKRYLFQNKKYRQMKRQIDKIQKKENEKRILKNNQKFKDFNIKESLIDY